MSAAPERGPLPRRSVPLLSWIHPGLLGTAYLVTLGVALVIAGVHGELLAGGIVVVALVVRLVVAHRCAAAGPDGEDRAGRGVVV